VKENEFDCIIIGAGHAGCEAARACYKLGVKTAIITLDENTIARLSCNPAVGGLAKSVLVKEVDALGGIMAGIADLSAIQYRVLNERKGPAVRALRVQCDKEIYSSEVKKYFERQKEIRIINNEAKCLLIKGNRVVGLQTSNNET